MFITFIIAHNKYLLQEPAQRGVHLVSTMMKCSTCPTFMLQYLMIVMFRLVVLHCLVWFSWFPTHTRWKKRHDFPLPNRFFCQTPTLIYHNNRNNVSDHFLCGFCFLFHHFLQEVFLTFVGAFGKHTQQRLPGSQCFGFHEKDVVVHHWSLQSRNMTNIIAVQGLPLCPQDGKELKVNECLRSSTCISFYKRLADLRQTLSYSSLRLEYPQQSFVDCMHKKSEGSSGRTPKKQGRL